MMRNIRLVVIRGAVICLVLAAAAAPLAAAERGAAPEAVSPSPATGVGEASVEVRCPTFAWTPVADASGYELVVLEADTAGEASGSEPRVATRVRLAAGARAWVPSLGNCLDRGGRYAWSVRALTPSGSGVWSQPALFRVAAGPSLDEVEAAMETLRRFVAEPKKQGEAAAALNEGSAGSGPDSRLQRLDESGPRRVPGGRDEPAAGGSPSPASGELFAAAAEARLAAPSVAALGSPSFSVSSNIDLGLNSNLFKNGVVYLWDDGLFGNTGVGRGALSSVTGTATGNTAVGILALADTTQASNNTAVGSTALFSNTTGQSNTAIGASVLLNNETGVGNTATGAGALFINTSGGRNTAQGFEALRSNTIGSYNTATGSRALFENTDGGLNTATGSYALYSNTTGWYNTAIGTDTLLLNTTGERNTAIGHQALYRMAGGQRNVAIGYRAGHGVTGTDRNDNILISNLGLAADSEKIRIGTQGTHDGTFIAGIRGTTTGVADAVTVVVDSDGQFGTLSSTRASKQDVQGIGELSERLLALRPVAFRYRHHAERDPDGPLQFGLIAEEVAEVFPDLVVRGEDGEPRTVRYHLLSSLLLNELQREHRRNLEHERALDLHRQELAALRERLSTIEGAGGSSRKGSWWRRGTASRRAP